MEDARRLSGALVLATAALTGTMGTASAEGLFDRLVGGLHRLITPTSQEVTEAPLPPQSPQAPRPPLARRTGSGPAFCVRQCDGKYFPLLRSAVSPAQMCKAFCPAAATKVYFGSSIDSAASATGERYVNSENAFAYRKALRADCTCNGHDPAGLAAIDLASDNSLRRGDVIATKDGLVAYKGGAGGEDKNPEFVPLDVYRGLTTEMRAHLDEVQIAPVRETPLATGSIPADARTGATPAAGRPGPARGVPTASN